MYDSHMPHTVTWNNFVDNITEGALKDGQIAAILDVAPSTISRWRKGQMPNPSHVVALCEHFNENPLVGFVAAGYLNSDQLGAILDKNGISMLASLEDFSTLVLAQELAKRAKECDERHALGN